MLDAASSQMHAKWSQLQITYAFVYALQIVKVPGFAVALLASCYSLRALLW
jgi:hypothetical protein